MSGVHQTTFGHWPGFVHFDRWEFDLLLSLYFSRVSDGEWRDYAIAHDATMARFCVFHNANDRPVFTIGKLAGAPRAGAYVVSDATGVIRRSHSLEEALGVFSRAHADAESIR